MDDLLKELKDVVSRKGDGEEYLSMNSRYVPLRIESGNFHAIHENASGRATGKKLLFIDGGNCVMFESASFCIGFIRVGGVLYQDNKRVSKGMKEFYVLIKEYSGRYTVKTSPETPLNGMAFDPEDELLRSGMERCSMARILSVIRRFAELGYAYDTSGLADYVILDGTLESRYPQEDVYLKRLLSTGKACALSKTCTLTTRNGLGILKVLSDMAPEARIGMWYYFPIVENNNPMHDARIYFTKLNGRSKYVFRFEIQDGFEDGSGGVDALFSCLSLNSTDPVFLGYPYGLIDADQYVRVSDDESRLLQTRISVKLGKDWNELSLHLNSMNAHSILDKIRY